MQVAPDRGVTPVFDDVRFSLRVLRKSPRFAFVAILTIALGIGANTAMFSVFNGVLLRALPYQQPEQLLRVSEFWPDFGKIGASYLNFVDWARMSHSFEAVSAYRQTAFTVTSSGEAERVVGQMVSADFLRTLKVQPVLGRSFLEAEDRPGGPPVALVSDGLWRRRFGGDPRILERTLLLNGTDYRIVGIVPSSVIANLFEMRLQPEVFVPLSQWNSPILQERLYHPGLRVIARLKAGVSSATAAAEMTAIGVALAKEYPKEDGGHSVILTSLRDDLVEQVRPTLWLLQGAVGFVLLIACANVANLLLSRATVRQREIALQMAVGASRLRIIRQLIAEATLLSLAGGALGLLLASWGMDLILKVVPRELPRSAEIGINGSVLVFALAASVGTGILFGLAPALQLSRPALREALAQSGRNLAGGDHRLRNALIVAQIALAVILLTGAGLLIQSIWRLGKVEIGADPHNVLLTRLALSPSDSSTPAATRAAYAELVDRAQRLPGVEAAAVFGDVPFEDHDTMPLWIEGRPQPKTVNEMPAALMFEASAGYLDLMRVPLRRGRFFTDHDDARSPRVAVIDESMAVSLFPSRDPIGARIFLGAPSQSFPAQIVGVIGHIKHWGPDESGDPRNTRAQVYIPFAQMPDSFLTAFADGGTLAVRAKSNPLALLPAIKAEVVHMHSGQPVYNPRTLEELIDNNLAPRRFMLWLLEAFGGMALLLAAIGMYGVISYLVDQRNREIGIRIALGAKRSDVLKLVLARGVALTFVGVGAGSAGALLLTQILAKMLYRVSNTDALTLVVVGSVLTAVALAACYLPARRAASVDPIVALHFE